ncbi:MAG: peptide MFS transporter [Candidatus Uhrbacteria bacterium]
MAAKQGHPPGLYVLFAVEAWERFCYYGMRAILVLYMVKYMFYDPAAATDPEVQAAITGKAGDIYGWFTGLVYMTPVIGGYIADRWWGQRRSIIVGGVLMGAGYFLMAVPHLAFFYVALGVVIVGNGFFKPNISTIVGQLYTENDPRRDGAFTIFYMGINLGAIFSPLVCGTLGQNVGWHWGFIAAGVGMIISLIIYFLFQHHLGDVGKVASYKNRNLEEKDTPLTREEIHRIMVIFVLAFFVIFFWVSFEQAGSSLTLFADRSTNRMIWGFEVPASWFQSANPIFIVLLAPIFSRVWVWLGERNMDPTSPVKMGVGLLLAAASLAIMIPASMLATGGDKVSMLWLWGVYFTFTVGEICLSPIGLSMVTKLAPAKFLSLCMGVWFLSNFASNLLAGKIAGMYDNVEMTTFFMYLALVSGVGGIVLLIFSPLIKKGMHGRG